MPVYARPSLKSLRVARDLLSLAAAISGADGVTRQDVERVRSVLAWLDQEMVEQEALEMAAKRARSK